MLEWKTLDDGETQLAVFDIESSIGAAPICVSVSAWNARGVNKHVFAIMFDESIFYMDSGIETIEDAKQMAVVVLEDYARNILMAIGRQDD